ncbi:hypothetical protein BJY52DRAFT_1183454 [Lactarius psammicola]|nr:hypothetical protein BJY52DRAFT_1183454 [Lactarius psammicola]
MPLTLCLSRTSTNLCSKAAFYSSRAVLNRAEVDPIQHIHETASQYLLHAHNGAAFIGCTKPHRATLTFLGTGEDTMMPVLTFLTIAHVVIVSTQLRSPRL